MQEINIEGFPFHNVTSDVNIVDGEVQLSSLRAEFCGGLVTGQGKIQLQFTPPKYLIELDCSNVSAEKFKQTLDFTTEYVVGTLSGKVIAHGDFEDPPRLVMTGDLRMDGGETDPFLLVTCKLHYEKRTLYLKQIMATCSSGGTARGDLTMCFRTEDGQFMTAELLAERIDLKTIYRLVGKGSSRIEGKVTGNTDIRYSWAGGTESLLTTGKFSALELSIFGIPALLASPYVYTGKTLTFSDITGELAGGTIKGNFLIDGDKTLLNVEGSKVMLLDVLRNLGMKEPVTGSTAFTAAIEILPNDEGLAGDCFIEVTEGNLSTAPGVMSALSLLALPSLNPHEFTEGRARLKFVKERIIVEEAELVSPKLSLKSGKGHIDFNGAILLQFDIYSEASILSLLLGKFGSALANLLDPTSKLFKVEITNTIMEPKSSLKAFPKKIDSTAEEPKPEEGDKKEGD
jgi:hypothetical protein